MLKRILFILFTLLVIHSMALAGYMMFEPEQPDDSGVPGFLNMVVDYDSLKEYTLSSGPSAIHYYYFCSFENPDCEYVENTILKSSARTTSVNIADLIEYVDITELEQKLQTNRIKSEWGITNYPAFIAVRNNADGIEVLNRLEWNPASPMNELQLNRWLMLNNLYDGEPADEIDEPAS